MYGVRGMLLFLIPVVLYGVALLVLRIRSQQFVSCVHCGEAAPRQKMCHVRLARHQVVRPVCATCVPHVLRGETPTQAAARLERRHRAR